MAIKAGAAGPKAFFLFTITIDINNVPANSTITQTFAVPGLLAGDIIIMNATFAEAGLVIGDVACITNDVLSFRVGNVTGGAIDPVLQSFDIVAIRRSLLNP